MTRKILNHLKSPSGKFILFFLAVIIFAFIFRYYKNLPSKKKESVQSFNDAILIEREYERFREEYQQLKNVTNSPIKSKQEHELEDKIKQTNQLEEKLNNLEKALAEEKAVRTLEKLQSPQKTPENSLPQTNKPDNSSIYSPVSLYSAKVTKNNKPLNKPLKEYAPYGRLIKCQLVNTVDSSSYETPIIALVTENLWHDGRIIIPAGTEVHGKAASLTKRNRIATEKDWILVWRTHTNENGFELPLSATALDHNRDIKTGRHNITDGSAGLRGDVIESDEYAKLRLYAALFIKGTAEVISEVILEKAKSSTENTLVNSSTPAEASDKSSNNDQLKVGVAKGVSQAIELYTQNMMDSISRDGVFVRVPAGKTFYLYVTQTIDKTKASSGAGKSQTQTAQNLASNNDLDEAQSLLLSLAKKKLQAEEMIEHSTEKE